MQPRRDWSRLRLTQLGVDDGLHDRQRLPQKFELVMQHKIHDAGPFMH